MCRTLNIPELGDKTEVIMIKLNGTSKVVRQEK